ncbi:MAG: TIM barrel protein [Lachnospiraceae bacterium]
MYFGCNMFGGGPIFQQNPEFYLRKLKTDGYTSVEPCITFLELQERQKQFLTLAQFEEYYPLMEAYDLQPTSCHILADDLLLYQQELEGLAKQYGIKQIVLGSPPDLDEAGYRDFAQKLKRYADMLKEIGLMLLLHNTDSEVRFQIEGKSAYEWILMECEGLVYAQPDVGWLLYGGVDPVPFLWRNQDRIRSLHYKDIKAVKDLNKENCHIVLGKGSVDSFSCFAFARALGIPQIIDQDRSDTDFMEDLAESVKLLNSYIHRRDRTNSILCIYDLDTKESMPIAKFEGVIEAPNWLDQNTLLFNQNGRIYRHQIAEGISEIIETGNCDNCNNDHVLSPDHKKLAISHSPKNSWMSQIYILPVEGGEPELVTREAPSFLHGYSPDGRSLSYTGLRNLSGASFEGGIYEIAVEGGLETCLTPEGDFYDGPEYAPDGERIWYNSTKSGLMQIWNMKRDGSDVRQITFDEQNNWFPHVSPDGKNVVNLSYRKGDLEPQEHLPNMQVALWGMDANGGNRVILHSFFGGQGSINVNSWSADSKQFAFVEYEMEGD